MKIGINVMGYPGDWNPIDNAVQAEAEGFESIWMTDGNGRMDALTAAAAIGARTSRVRIGLGIVPVFNRPSRGARRVGGGALAHRAGSGGARGRLLQPDHDRAVVRDGIHQAA